MAFVGTGALLGRAVPARAGPAGVSSEYMCIYMLGMHGAWGRRARDGGRWFGLGGWPWARPFSFLGVSLCLVLPSIAPSLLPVRCPAAPRGLSLCPPMAACDGDWRRSRGQAAG